MVKRVKGVRMRHPLAFDQVKLGDLTLDVENPWNDCREFPHPLDEDDINIVDKLNLEAIHSQVTEANAQAQLADFLRSQAKMAQTSVQRESVGRARCYRIGKSGDKFKLACRDPDIREWLTEYHVKSGMPVYMIVGLYTYENAQLAEGGSTNREGSGRAGSGAVTGGGGIKTGRQHGTIFTTASENIFAMEYRQVKKRWFSKKDLDSAILEQGNSWEVFWGMRAPLAKETGEGKSVVDLELTDDDAEDVDDPGALFDFDAEN